MDKELAKRTVERLHKYLRDNYGSEDVAQLETFVKSLVVSDGCFVADAGSILDTIKSAIDKEDNVLMWGNNLFQELPRVIDNIKDEWHEYLKGHLSFDDLFEPQDGERFANNAMWAKDVSDNDRKVLRFLNDPRYPKRIERVLDSYYPKDMGVSRERWINDLIDISEVNKSTINDISRHYTIDPKNVRCMRDWAKEQSVSNNPDEDEKVSVGSAESAIIKLKHKVGTFLGKDETEYLLRMLPTIKPKEVKKYFDERHILTKCSFKEFWGMCADVVPQRQGDRGWNYENARK